MISTGVSRSRVRPPFAAVVDEAVARLTNRDVTIDVYVYGSVATGTAVTGVSDVDLLTIGATPVDAAEVAQLMSRVHAQVCRSVDVAVAQHDDYAGDTDEVYGNRAFLRHYCVHLAGPRMIDIAEDFPADRRAARGFNGDIDRHLHQWRAAFAAGTEPAQLGRTVARKTLLAVAGLVSVHDRTWTTDRDTAALRWAQLHTELADDLATLQTWSHGTAIAARSDLGAMLSGTIPVLVASFDLDIGLWAEAGA